jgi:hypothetical protein
MKTKTFTLVLLGMMVLMISCKKDEKTNAELILGKWAVVSDATSGKQNGVSFSNTYTGTSSDYLNFGSDGKITGIQNGDSLSATYSVSENTLTSVNSHNESSQSTILSLTDNSLVIYNKDYTDANNYDEETLTLKK